MDANAQTQKTLQCLRCEDTMVYQGNFKFHEGSRVGVFGDLLELFTNRESFDLYVCPKCGKVEFLCQRNKVESPQYILGRLQMTI